MILDPATRGRLAIAAVALFIVSQSLHLLKEELSFDLTKLRNPESVAVDRISAYRYMERFEELKLMLPAGEVVGYIQGESNLDGDYYATQYAMAPFIVDNSLDHALIIGNFRDPDRDLDASIAGKATVIKDFGNGILLLKTERR